MPDTFPDQGLPVCTTVGSLLAEDETDFYDGFIWGPVVESRRGNLSSDGIVTSPLYCGHSWAVSSAMVQAESRKGLSHCVLNFILGGMGIAH